VNTLLDIEDLKECKRVFIYGSGQLGRNLQHMLADEGISCAFIDSFREGEIGGVPIMKFEKYMTIRDPDDVILIASEWLHDIVKVLDNAGITKYYGAIHLPF
jgi:prephenate dehydrogenase